MDGPPQSLDLHIIKAVWAHLDKELSKREPKPREELWCFTNLCCIFLVCLLFYFHVIQIKTPCF